MIEAVDLSKVYGDGTSAVRGLNLKVEPGEMLFVRGHSGAGKTTLLRLIMGRERPTSGTLHVAGCAMDSPGALRDLRRKMGIIFQDFRLMRGRTSLENVEMGLRVLGITGDSMRERALEYLEMLGMGERAGALADSLSWGERQRLEVARALARDPSIILADEPTGNLDGPMSARVLEMLNSAHSRGATVIVATHAREALSDTAHRIITLDRGSLVEDTGRRPVGRGR